MWVAEALGELRAALWYFVFVEYTNKGMGAFNCGLVAVRINTAVYNIKPNTGGVSMVMAVKIQSTNLGSQT